MQFFLVVTILSVQDKYINENHHYRIKLHDLKLVKSFIINKFCQSEEYIYIKQLYVYVYVYFIKTRNAL